MRITDALLGEHGLFYALFDELSAATAKDDDNLPALVRMLASALLSHAELEEQHLFPALRPYLSPMGPLAVMEMEHRQIHDLVGTIAETDDPALLRNHVHSLIELAVDHFAKEEGILFHLADRFLGNDELTRLGDAWAGARGVNLEAGGCAA